MTALVQILMGVFTAVWGWYAGRTVDAPATETLRWVYLVVGVLLMLDGLRRMRIGRPARPSVRSRIVVPWGWIACVAAEVVVINILDSILSDHGASAYVIPMIATVVGLHLFPLGWVFHTRDLHVAGATVTTLGVAGLLGVAVLAGHRGGVDAVVAFLMGALTCATGIRALAAQRSAAPAT